MPKAVSRDLSYFNSLPPFRKIVGGEKGCSWAPSVPLLLIPCT
jgi:hypothetical protein